MKFPTKKSFFVINLTSAGMSRMSGEEMDTAFTELIATTVKYVCTINNKFYIVVTLRNDFKSRILWQLKIKGYVISQNFWLLHT